MTEKCINCGNFIGCIYASSEEKCHGFVAWASEVFMEKYKEALRQTLEEIYNEN
jgi:hypothetical protein